MKNRQRLVLLASLALLFLLIIVFLSLFGTNYYYYDDDYEDSYDDYTEIVFLEETDIVSDTTTMNCATYLCPSDPAATAAASVVMMRNKEEEELGSCPVTHNDAANENDPTNNNNEEEDPWSQQNLQELTQLWKLSQEDVHKLLQVKDRLKDIQHDWNEPQVVLAFMKGPDRYNVKQTEKAMRKLVQWRQKHNVDALLNNNYYKPNPLLLDYLPIAFLKGYDKDGDPIYIERGGAIDVHGLLKRFSREELDTHATWLREVQSSGQWIDEYERRQNRKMREITVIYDLEGLNRQHLHPRVINFFKHYMDTTEKYYPGPIKRVIVIRAPAMFRTIWNAIKGIFSKEFRESMILTEPNQHLQVLSQYLDINILPPCINPNGAGTTATGMPDRMEGGKIPDYVGKQGRGYQRITKPTTAVTDNHDTNLYKQQPQHEQQRERISAEEDPTSSDTETSSSSDGERASPESGVGRKTAVTVNTASPTAGKKEPRKKRSLIPFIKPVTSMGVKL